jgi:hypothetical protein
MSGEDAAEAVTDDAASLAAEATGGDGGGAASSAAEGAADAAADAATDGESKGIVGALLHTDPDASPESVQGPRWVGEFVVGARKVMDALGIEAGDGDGTPALMNFYRGAMSLREWAGQKANDGDSGDGDGGEPEVTIRDS